MRALRASGLLALVLALDAASAFHFHHQQLPAVSSGSRRRQQQRQPLTCQLRLPRVPVAALTVLAVNLLAPFALQPAKALPQTAPEVNPQKLLINALPNKNPTLADLAFSLAKMTTEGSGNIRSIDAKGFKGIKPWPEVVKAQRAAAGVLGGRSKDLLAGVKPGNEQAAQAALESLKQSVEELGAAAEVQDRFGAVDAQVKALKALDRLGTLEVRSSVSQSVSHASVYGCHVTYLFGTNFFLTTGARLPLHAYGGVQGNPTSAGPCRGGVYDQGCAHRANRADARHPRRVFGAFDGGTLCRHGGQGGV